MEKDPTLARADVESSRAVLTRFADYLASQQTVLIEQWTLTVRRDPKIATADRLTYEQLLDHLPLLYADLCEFLRRRDAASLVEEVRDGAEQHGEYRWRDGYRIDELLREMEAFRRIVDSAVTRYAQQEPTFKGAVEATARAIVHQFFAEVSINSARQFAEEQGAVVQEYTRKLEAANVELGRTNAGLKQALGERQRLTTVIAHELRNFLQGLAHRARLWEQQRAPSEARTEIVAQIHDMEAMLTQLLEHSLLITSHAALARDRFDPAVLHAELAEMYQPLAEARGLVFVADASAAPREVIGDRARVRQIAINLLANAVKYTEAGDITFICALHDEQRWAILISDTGPGLTSRATGRLFGDLAGDDDASPPGRGMGLGMTRDLVELLGGSMQVATRAGAGTRIEVLLPRAPTEQADD